MYPLNNNMVRLPDGRIVTMEEAQRLRMPINTVVDRLPTTMANPVGGPENIGNMPKPVQIPAQAEHPIYGAYPENMPAKPPIPTPASQSPQQSRPTGLLGMIGNHLNKNGVDQSDLLMALGSGMMGLSQDPNLQQFGASGFSQIQKNRDTRTALGQMNQTISHLEKLGTPAAKKALEYIKATRDVKGGMKLYSEFGSVVQGSGSELASKYGIQGLDPKKPYNFDTLTGKVTGIGSGGTAVEVNLGDKAGAEALAKANAQYIADTRTQFVDAGKTANQVANSYMRFLNTMGDVQTGNFAENKQKVRSFLEGIGLGSFIDLDKYSDSQQMIAATNDLVINELRKNKGPQTDFDAIFAQQYLPSLGKTGDTNRAIATYALSHAQFDQILGGLANRLSIRDPEAEGKIADLNDYRTNFSAFVQMKNGQPMYFSEYYKQVKAKHNLTDEEVLQAWSDFTNKQRY